MILQKFQTVYLVQYERFIPPNVPERPTFLIASKRFLTFLSFSGQQTVDGTFTRSNELENVHVHASETKETLYLNPF